VGKKDKSVPRSLDLLWEREKCNVELPARYLGMYRVSASTGLPVTVSLSLGLSPPDSGQSMLLMYGLTRHADPYSRWQMS